VTREIDAAIRAHDAACARPTISKSSVDALTTTLR